MKRITAYAPASIGNVAAGFDILGAALAPLDGSLWGDQVSLEEAERASFTTTGPFAHRLPADPEQNLVRRSQILFEEALGRPLPPLAVTLHKGLPVNSGLGSSAASIVAALLAFNAWCGEPFGPAELLILSGQAEGLVSGSIHYDNVAPCLLGGLRLVVGEGRTRLLPFPDDLVFVMALPALELGTKAAREALPAMVKFGEAVAFGQNLAAFVHALHDRDSALLQASFRDLLAEPHRARLVQGFGAVKAAALGAGALGCSLSGSGPSVFAVAEGGGAEGVAQAMADAFVAAGVAVELRLCGLDAMGARLL